MIDVFLSVGKTFTSDQESFVAALEQLLRDHSLNPRAVGRNEWTSGNPLVSISKRMGECRGTVIVAFERLFIEKGVEFRGTDAQRSIDSTKVTTCWNQIEAALAFAKGHPLLVLVEEGVRLEGLVDKGHDWWVQNLRLEPSSLQAREFLSVFGDWKRRIEKQIQEAPEAATPDIETLTLGQLIRGLGLKQLATCIGFLAAGIAAVFSAGATFQPALQHLWNPTTERQVMDDGKTREYLEGIAAKNPPLMGNSVDGNVRPVMDVYLEGFMRSNKPQLLREVMSLQKLIEQKANPYKPREYFSADSEFRASLERFRANVTAYSKTGSWDPSN